MQHLETGIMDAFWQKVLLQFQANSLLLQSADQKVNVFVRIYDSSGTYKQSLRDHYDEFEAEGKTLSSCDKCQAEVGKRMSKQNCMHDEQDSELKRQLTLLQHVHCHNRQFICHAIATQRSLFRSCLSVHLLVKDSDTF